MPELTEDRRKQLDGIVSQMLANGEPDANVQAVVDDFKTKYTAAPAEEKSVGGFLHNVVSSGVDFAKNTGEGLLSAAKLAAAVPQAIADPRKAAEMGGQLIEGIKHAPEAAQSLLQGVKDRYGSLDAIGNTLYHDPVGAASDLSLLAGGVGSLAKAGGLNKVAKAAELARDVSNPMTAVAKGVEAVGSKGPALQRGGVSLYNRILKPDRGQLQKLGPQWGDTLDEKGLEVAKQLLQEGVNVTPSGVNRLADDISALEQKRSGIIKGLDNYHPVDNPTGNVTRVPTAPMGQAIDDAARFTGRQLDPSEDVASIKSGHQRLLANRALTTNKRAVSAPAEPPADPHVVKGVGVPDSVDAAMKAEQQLGGQAQNIPDSLFAGASPEQVKAARQIGPMAFFVPRRLLGADTQKAPIIIENEMAGKIAPRPTTEVVGRKMLPQVRLSRLEDMARGTRAQMRARGGNAYGGGRLPSDVARDKAMLMGANQAIGSADPAIKPLADEMARKITLEDFLERGSLRSGKHELLSGFDVIAGANSLPWLATRLAQRPAIGSRAARGLFKLGGMVDGATLSPAARQLALLAALEGRDGEDESK